MKKHIVFLIAIVAVVTISVSASTFSLEGCKTYLDSLHDSATTAIIAYFDGSGSYEAAISSVMSYFIASC